MLKEIFQRIGKYGVEPDWPVDISELQRIIKYKFNNSELLIQAVKHRSFLSISEEQAHYSNERMEFLGDAVLDLIVTEYLYTQYPADPEGSLSKKKSVLVSRPVLAKITDELSLGKFLLMNKGEEKTGGRERQSNLANLFESILGAIYLDGNYTKAKNFVHRFLLANKDRVLNQNIYFNYKSDLLEYSQGKGWGYPVYEVVDASGPDHHKKFVVIVRVNNETAGKGIGNSKKTAEQMAAKNALQKLEVH
ncbi:MAG: ribonuclease III [Calditrichaceae bacterium]|nr:ribonuclease III [Calditrichaceae bacterium]MBN2707667.1 ribonuclease III [Calditrichaceae bacterium]RQV94848.1 MAG: ribonuclease III [Calditrichota bacterium]